MEEAMGSRSMGWGRQTWQTATSKALQAGGHKGRTAVVLARYYKLPDWGSSEPFVLVWGEDRRGVPQRLALGDKILVAEGSKLALCYDVEATCLRDGAHEQVDHGEGIDGAVLADLRLKAAARAEGCRHAVALYLRPAAMPTLPDVSVTNSPSGWHML
jgi:hypothetical protein